MAVVIAQTANPNGVSSSSNVATYSNQAIGDAAANRIVVVVVGCEVTGGTINSCTIDYGSGDTAMTAGTSATQGVVNARTFYLAVPTGTTATIKVTYGANPTNTQNHIAVYKVLGGVFSSAGGNNSTDMDANAPLTTGSTTIASGGGMIAVATGATDTVAKTWANLDEDIDMDAGVLRFTTATSTTAGTATRTCTGGTNGEDGAMSWLIFTANVSPTVALGTPADTAAISDTTPALAFTGTDTESNDVRYNVQIGTGTTFSNTVVYDNDTLSDIADSGATRTFSHTVGNYSDRCLIVATAMRGGVSVSSATYNGDSLTKITSYQLGGDQRVELWYLLSPDVGTYDVVVNLSATQNLGVVAASYYNVDSVGYYNGGTGGPVTSTSISMTNTAGHAIVDVLGLQTGSLTPDTAANAGQVMRRSVGTTNMQLAYGDKLSATTNNTMSWTFGSNYYGEAAAVLVPKTTLILDHTSNVETTAFTRTGDSDPFTSGQEVTYTVPVADELAFGTYYWRVRGLDPSGSNTYGAWSDTRSFTIAAGTAANSERGLYTTGATSANSERGLYIIGEASTNSERGLYTTGQVLENSERGLYTEGQDSTNSERGLYAISSTLANSERGLYTKGAASTESERGLYAAGKASTDSERGLYTIGSIADTSERGLYTEGATGATDTDSERGLYTHGKDTSNSERGLYTEGGALANSERGLYASGVASANSERTLYAIGSTLSNSERSLYLQGAISTNSERGLCLTGNASVNSERGLYVIGNISSTSERLLYIIGKVLGGSERGLYTEGLLAGETSERGLYTSGVETTTLSIDYFEISFYKEASGTRGIYVAGGLAGESERRLYTHGGIEEDSERSLYLDCVEGSMRNMWLRGLDPFEDSDATPGSFTDTDDATISSWVDTDDATTSSWVDTDTTPGGFTDTTTTTGGFVDIG